MAKKRTGRKRCSIDGCRKLAVQDGACTEHFEEKVESSTSSRPEDELRIQLTEMERLQFVEVDTALRNLQLEAKNVNQEQQLEKVQFDLRTQGRQQQINRIRAEMTLLSDKQKTLLRSFSNKYVFDPQKAISIDDKTGVVHEH